MARSLLTNIKKTTRSAFFVNVVTDKDFLKLKGEADLKYCSQTDILSVLPIQEQPGVSVKN